jgi:UDPglucose--hexose-1-phosphate uridylyltransferase
MPELRKDPIVGRWVIIAENRARRPIDFENRPMLEPGALCPFCEGHEDKTPDEIIAYRNPQAAANRPGWRIRVVPNKFPALQIEGDLEKRGEGIYDMMEGIGAHEVIIETPEHVTSTSDLSAKSMQEVFWAYRDRLVDLKKDKRLVYGMLFKNAGLAAGASLEHSHSQLIVTPVVPISVWEEMTGSLEFFNYRGRCVYCDMIQQELAAERRIVLDSPLFVAFCPYASRFPFETWILPKVHSSHYENIQKNGIEDLSRALREVVARIETALDRPAYNYIIHTSPFDSTELPHYHWHVELMPRLTKTAGFEWGSGFYINPVPPEDAAAFLREVVAPLDIPRTLPAAKAG